MNINIIADASGSMSSMAKINIVCALLKFCEDIPIVHKKSFSELNFVYYLLGDSSEPVLFDKKIILKASGSVELCAMGKLLEKTNKKECNFLFLSDGRFSNDDKSKFQQITVNYPDMRFISVAVGADADEFLLKDISTCKKVFHPEDIIQAVETFLSVSDKCPPSASFVNFSVPDAGEENWDE